MVKKNYSIVSFTLTPDETKIVDSFRELYYRDKKKRPSRDEIARLIFLLGIEALIRGYNLPGDPSKTLRALRKVISDLENSGDSGCTKIVISIDKIAEKISID